MKIEPCPICNKTVLNFKFTRGTQEPDGTPISRAVCPNCNYSTAWHKNDFDTLAEWNLTDGDINATGRIGHYLIILGSLMILVVFALFVVKVIQCI